MLEVRDDAENLGGRGAREKPLGYAGAELEKDKISIFMDDFSLMRHLLAGLILAGSALALPPTAPFGVGGWLGREADEVTRLPLPSCSSLPSLCSSPPSRLSETSSPSSWVSIC